MPRYLVERNWPDSLTIPLTEEGVKACMMVVDNNGQAGVTWVHSYVSPDHRKTFCIYDGPSPEAIREVALVNKMPADKITPVTVLDPYFYRP